MMAVPPGSGMAYANSGWGAYAHLLLELKFRGGVLAMIPLEEIQKRAEAMNMTLYERLDKKTLIRAIQEKEGHNPCFGDRWCNCIVKESCFWKDDCPAAVICF